MYKCIVIIVFFFFCGFLFRKFREGNAQKTLFQISVAQLISWLLFLVGVEQTENPFVCVAVAAVLHYFLLATFMWMLMEAVLQYHAFVKVFGTHISYFMLKASLIAWGKFRSWNWLTNLFKSSIAAKLWSHNLVVLNLLFYFFVVFIFLFYWRHLWYFSDFVIFELMVFISPFSLFDIFSLFLYFAGFVNKFNRSSIIQWHFQIKIQLMTYWFTDWNNNWIISFLVLFLGIPFIPVIIVLSLDYKLYLGYSKL